MGIVERNVMVEDYLNKKSISWESLSDKEYKDLVKNWRNVFEDALISGTTRSGR